MQYFPHQGRSLKVSRPHELGSLVIGALDAQLADAPDASGYRSVSTTAGTRPALGMPVVFIAGWISTLCFALRPGAARTLRIEAHGLVTRRSKAVARISRDGNILSRGDEVVACKTALRRDGGLDVQFSFIPFHSRCEAFFLFFEDIDPGSPTLAAVRDVAHYRSMPDDEDRRSRSHMPATRIDGLWFACQRAAFYRNYLHVEFEAYKPGAALLGIAVESPMPLAATQLWTNQAGAMASEPGELTPMLPPHALPAPGLMDVLGEPAASMGFTLTGLFAEYAAFDRRPLEETDAARNLVLNLRFSDGTKASIPLCEMRPDAIGSDGWTATLEARLAEFRATLSEPGIFLEIGARGPVSAATRQQREGEWIYLACDYTPDDNIDLVADAHLLSDFIPQGTVQVIYSDTVMEHILSPLQVILEANKVLQDGGLFIVRVPTTWPLHAEPWDYWRYSINVWKGLLNANTGFEILDLVETGSASIVPDLPLLSAMNRMQHSPAPLCTAAIARKIGAPIPGTTGWSGNLESGDYDPAH